MTYITAALLAVVIALFVFGLTRIAQALLSNRREAAFHARSEELHRQDYLLELTDLRKDRSVLTTRILQLNARMATAYGTDYGVLSHEREQLCRKLQVTNARLHGAMGELFDRHYPNAL